MSLKTPLHEQHVNAGGKLVDFAGYSLPINYGSQIEEHHAVRNDAGMFDVSHMTIIDLQGAGTESWLRYMLTNDVAELTDGKALYSCMCNEQGGVIDDLIAYRIQAERYRLIVNAATRQKDLAWLRQHKPESVNLSVPDQIALIAVQGPQSLSRSELAVSDVLAETVSLKSIPRFGCVELADWFIGRTGYTGEDGVEIALPAQHATELWTALSHQGVRPVGLGARDTLRLEAGMSLYGNDLDDSHTPLESGIGWTVNTNDSSREFVGGNILLTQKQSRTHEVMIGLVLDGRGVLRSSQSVLQDGKEIGLITSGTFSPTLQQSIALARVSHRFKGSCSVRIRDKELSAHTSAVPFVKNGQPNN